MSKRFNQAGREFVADRFIELKTRSSSNAFTRIRTEIQQQTTQKDLEKLQQDLDKIASDGVVTVSEKEALRREWASLQQTYSSVNEQFSSDPELADNPSFKAMQTVYKELSELMTKILDDMSSDYVGEDAKELSDLFAAIYSYLTICQSILNSRDEFLRTYSLIIVGSRDILDGTKLTAGIYKSGIEQQNPEFINGQNYTWTRLDDPDGFEPHKGKSLTLDMDDLPESPCRFSVTWSDSSGKISDGLSVILTLEYGTIIEYAWSNALSEEELQAALPSSWNNPALPQPAGVKYLWRRESDDNRKTYQYFRMMGADGEPGYQIMLTADTALIPSASDGTVSSANYGFISQVVIYRGFDVENIGEWALSISAIPENLLTATVDSTGAVSLTGIDKSIDSGTLTITAKKDDITLSKDISVAKVKQGVDGSVGAAPQYYYKYTDTDDPDAYRGGGTLFVHGSKLLAVGTTLLTTGMAGWLDHVPQGPQYEDDFLWTKIVHSDGTVDIIPPAKKGDPARNIVIIASDDSYELTTRGIVRADNDFTFTIERSSVAGPATWWLDPPSGTQEMIHGVLETAITGTVDGNNPDVYHVHLSEGSTIQKFTVFVMCEGFEATRSLPVYGIDGGEEQAYYFKIYPLHSTDPLPIYNKELGTLNWNGADANLPTEAPEGPLITGDYILHLVSVISNASDTTPSVEPVPFYYDEEDDEWKMLDVDSPYYSETMGTVLADVVNMPDMPVTVGAFYGFFQNLAAQNAFITNLFSKNIHFTGAIYSGAYDANGNNPKKGTGTYISAQGKLRAINAYLEKLEAKSAKIEGEFETSDSQGIILKSSKSSGSVTASDTETRKIGIAPGNKTAEISGLPSNAEYIQLSGYDEWFFAALPQNGNNKFIYDGDYFYDGEISGLPPLYDNDEEHDSKETFGKYILSRAHTTNPSSISLWTGDSDGSYVTGTYTASFSLGDTSDERSIVLLSQKAVPYGTILGGNGSGPGIAVKVEQVYTYTFGILPMTQTTTIKEWTAKVSSLFGDSINGNYIEANDLTLPAFSLDYEVTARTLKVTYTLNASYSQQSVGAKSIHTVVILPIEDLVPVQYNKVLYPLKSYETTLYDYLFVEHIDGWTEDSSDLSLPQPAVVKSLYSGDASGIIEYSGPAASVYDSSKTLLCTTADLSGWLDAGGFLYMSCYQLYYQLRSLGEGIHDVLSSTYISAKGTSSKEYAGSIEITDEGNYIEYAFYEPDNGPFISSYRYYSDGRLYNAIDKLDDAYYVSIASSLRGVTTATLYPATGSANIGSTGNRYNHIYVDGVTTSNLSLPSSNYIPLPNGYKLEKREFGYVDIDADLVWHHIDFYTDFASAPAVFVNCIRDDSYISNPNDFEDRYTGYMKNLSTTGVDVAVFGKLRYQLIAVGK